MATNNDFIHTLHDRGGRLTRQRRLVLEILENSTVHLDAETIYQEAKRRDENISLATVYRSLALLKEAGLIEEHRLGEDHGHFETIPQIPHYHFVCLDCGRVIEFESGAVTAAVRELSEQKCLQVTDINLHLNGYCPECRPRKPATRSA